MGDLPITLVTTVSVNTPQTGLGKYNTSNVGLFTRELPGASFITNNLPAGFKLNASDLPVISDFGTGSVTSQMATAIFAQQPNILAGGGQLVIIPFALGVQSIVFSAVPGAGSYTLSYNAVPVVIPFGDNAAALQTALQTLPLLGAATVTGSTGAGFVVTLNLISGTALPLILTANTTGDTITIASTETIQAAIARTAGLVQYFGVVVAEVSSQVNMLAAAPIIQSLNKVALWPSRTLADINPGGMLDLLRTGTLKKNRGLFYGGATDLSALLFAASYAGRGFSTDFTGSLTTITMHLKDLIGIQPDPSASISTVQGLAAAAGADIYASIQGIPKVVTIGTNGFFDDVYNQEWFVGDLIVNQFNALATIGTKIPQTEEGMDQLKDASVLSCEAGDENGYIAPGAWSGATFGNQADFLRNIADKGYYIYSQPIAQQDPTVRAARQAPLVQIAIKRAGAIHSSQLIVNIQ